MGTIYPINTRYPHSYLVASITSLVFATLLILYTAYVLSGRWRAWHGVQTTGIITDLSEINRPDGSTFYFVSVETLPATGKALQLERRVDAVLFSTLRVNQRRLIRYQADQPANFLLQPEPWSTQDDGFRLLLGLAGLSFGFYGLADWRRNRRLYA